MSAVGIGICAAYMLCAVLTLSRVRPKNILIREGAEMFFWGASVLAVLGFIFLATRA